jgi:hypothetical protein
MQTCGSAAPSPVWSGLNVGFQPRGMCGSRLQRRSAIRPLCRATVLAHGGPSSDIAMPRRGPSRQPLVSSAEELILGLCQQLVIDPPISTTGGPTMLKLSIHGRFRFTQEYVNHMANLRFVGGFLISLFTALSGPWCTAQRLAGLSPFYRMLRQV